MRFTQLIPSRVSCFSRFSTVLAAAMLVCTLAGTPQPAQAQSEASVVLSVLPVASVVGAASAVGVGASTVASLPLALSVGGAVLVIEAVEASAHSTVYLLKRASDGAQVSVQVSGHAVSATAYGVGTVITCSVLASGVILSAAGEVLAFIPNALGRALLHDERL